MTKLTTALEAEKERFDNIIFPDDEDGIEHVDMEYKEFMKELHASNLRILSVVNEIIEKERQTWAKESIGAKAVESVQKALAITHTK